MTANDKHFMKRAHITLNDVITIIVAEHMKDAHGFYYVLYTFTMLVVVFIAHHNGASNLLKIIRI